MGPVDDGVQEETRAAVPQDVLHFAHTLREQHPLCCDAIGCGHREQIGLRVLHTFGHAFVSVLRWLQQPQIRMRYAPHDLQKGNQVKLAVVSNNESM